MLKDDLLKSSSFETTAANDLECEAMTAPQSFGEGPLDEREDAACGAARFAALFDGHERAHGTYGKPVWELEKKKWGMNGTARTVHEPVTKGLWNQHLRGERPLGVIPITVDGTCKWGSIDYDVYDADLLAVIGRVEKAGLPLVPCRS